MEQNPAPPAVNVVKGLLQECRRREERLISRLHALVEIESPSDDKEGVDRAVALFDGWARESGGATRRHIHRLYGDSLEARFGISSAGALPILLLGHLDTVWDRGTLARMPWKVTRKSISGPGALDMKAGAVMALSAVEIVCDLGLLRRPVTILLHGDEEIGSPVSRKLTESLAKRSSAVYVLEPAQGEAGAYKTARKAVGMYRLEVGGVAAHSGVDFERGHSAIVEIARQIEKIGSFTDLRRGITVNPGVVQGGSRSNVVADRAWAEIDVRLLHARDLDQLDLAFRRLTPVDRFCSLAVSGGMNRPPMERTAGTITLFRRARKLAAAIGFDLRESSTGGGSDGNFTSALGIPTLDGMGAVGAGAHAVHEHLLRSHLAPRTALLAAMLL